MRRVTGIGGIFFKAKDPAALKTWYSTHLGIDIKPWARHSTGPTRPANPSVARRPGASPATPPRTSAPASPASC